MITLPKPEDVIAIIREVANTEVMPKWRNLQEDDISEKGPGDFVTVADERSEAAFTRLLPGVLEGSLVVGEEAVSKDKSVLETFEADQPVWVIDPIDGTYNFKSGRSLFGILISLVYKGETQMGFLFDAPQDECFYAIKGKGAFSEGGQKISFPSDEQASKTAVAQMTGFAGGAQAWHFEKLKDYVAELTNIRCSLHDALHFMRGENDFVLWQKTTPWDQAGTTLMAEELGGYVCYIDGQKYSPVNAPQNKFLIVAPDQEKWQMIVDAINDSGLKIPA